MRKTHTSIATVIAVGFLMGLHKNTQSTCENLRGKKYFSRKGAKPQRKPLATRQRLASLRLCVRNLPGIRDFFCKALPHCEKSARSQLAFEIFPRTTRHWVSSICGPDVEIEDTNIQRGIEEDLMTRKLLLAVALIVKWDWVAGGKGTAAEIEEGGVY